MEHELSGDGSHYSDVMESNELSFTNNVHINESSHII